MYIITSSYVRHARTSEGIRMSQINHYIQYICTSLVRYLARAHFPGNQKTHEPRTPCSQISRKYLNENIKVMLGFNLSTFEHGEQQKMTEE